MGMSVVEFFMQEVNGFVRFGSQTEKESPDNHGTEFDLYIPLYSSE